MTETARLALEIDFRQANDALAKINKGFDGLVLSASQSVTKLDSVDKRLSAIAISARGSAQNTEFLTKGLSAISLNGQRTAETLARIEQGLSRIALNTQKAASGTRAYGGAAVSAKVQTETFGQALDNLGKKLGVTGGALQRLFVGFSAVFILRDAAKTIAGFESSLATLRGVTGLSQTSQTFQDIEAQVRRLGATTRFTAQEAAEGQLFLARAGFSAQQVLAALPATLNLAAAGNLELGQAADLASNAVTQFNLRASDTTRVVDSLVNVSNNSNTNIQQLGEALKFSGPVAASFGISIETTNAALGKLGDAGIQATLAGTGLRGVLGRLADPSTEASAALKKLVGDMSLVDVKTRGLVPVLKTLQDANLDVVDSFRIFGRLQAGPGLILTQAADDIERLVKLQQDGAGAAQDLANIQNDTLQGSFLALRSAIQEAYLATGDAGLAGGLKAITDAGTGAIRILNGTASAAELADGGAATLAASLKTLAIVSVGLTGIRLVKYLNEVRIAIAAVGTAASATPIGAIATGAVLVGSALYGAISVANQTADSFKELRERTTNLTDALTDLAKARARLETASASERFSGGLRAELSALDAVRDDVVGARANGIANLQTVSGLAGIIQSEALNGTPFSLVGPSAADDIVRATLDDLSDGFRREGINHPFDIVQRLLGSGVLDVDEPSKAAKDNLKFTETPEQRIIRGTHERSVVLRNTLAGAARQGGDITDPEVLARAIAEANFKVVRVTADATLKLVGLKESFLRQVGADTEKTNAEAIKARTAGGNLTGDIFALKEEAAAGLERATGKQISTVEKYQRALEKLIARHKENGATEEVIAKLRAEDIPGILETTRKTDELTAANERKAKADAEAKRVLDQRARAEENIAGIIKSQQEELRLARLESDEDRALSTKLIKLEQEALNAGRKLRIDEINLIIKTDDELRNLIRSREKAAALAAELAANQQPFANPFAGQASDPIDFSHQSLFSLLSSGGEEFRDRRDQLKEAQGNLDQFFGDITSEKRFIQADITATISGRPEDADRLRESVAGHTELNRLLHEAGIESAFAQAQAHARYDAELAGLHQLDAQLRRTQEERRLFDDFGNAGAQAFANIALGANSVKDSITGVISELSRLTLNEFFTKPAASLLSNGLSSLFGGGGSLFNLIPNANGGILPGSLDYRALAGGGVATRPTLALIREAGQNEAVVPLPDGRSIPVNLNLGGLRGLGGGSSSSYVDNSTTVYNNVTVNGGRRSGRGGGRDTFGRSDRQIASDIVRGLRSAG